MVKITLLNYIMRCVRGWPTRTPVSRPCRRWSTPSSSSRTSWSSRPTRAETLRASPGIHAYIHTDRGSRRRRDEGGGVLVTLNNVMSLLPLSTSLRSTGCIVWASRRRTGPGRSLSSSPRIGARGACSKEGASFIYLGANNWNKLSVTTKSLTTFNAFRNFSCQ